MSKPRISQLVGEEAAKVAVDQSVLSEEEQSLIAQQIAHEEMKRLAQEEMAAASARAERGEVHRMKTIDAHEGKLATVTSLGWAPMTPSMCTADPNCCFDAAEALGFKGGWESIPITMLSPINHQQLMRDFAVEKLELHKALRHASAGPSHVRTAEQAKAARRASQHPLPEGFIINPRL